MGENPGPRPRAPLWRTSDVRTREGTAEETADVRTWEGTVDRKLQLQFDTDDERRGDTTDKIEDSESESHESDEQSIDEC